MGHLTVILGCMFAQKTTELVRMVRRYRSIGYQVLVVNSAQDVRYQEQGQGQGRGQGRGQGQIVTHDEKREEAVMVRCLSDVDMDVRSGRFQAVVVDEGQFFEDLFEKVTQWADEVPGLHVVVAGLDGTFEREPFGDMLRLIPHAEEVKRLSALCALCRDGTKAIYSKRKESEKRIVVVAGSDMYQPVCRKHYLEK